MNKLKHTPTKNKICIFVKIVVKYYYLIQDRYYDKQQFISLAHSDLNYSISNWIRNEALARMKNSSLMFLLTGR